MLGVAGLHAQEDNSIRVRSDETGQEEEFDVPEGMQSDLDSLLLDWQSRHYITSPSGDCHMTASSPTVSREVYIDRLSRIPSVIEMPYNSVVQKFIEAYATRLRSKVSYMLASANYFMPIFEEALDLYDLPMELKYLPIIESALNPRAVSRQGATGLWQFMLATGKTYGLEQNSLVDDRRDPIKSTWAAARYLKDLYAIYQDWNLVLAAYNCGPGTINKAIRRAGGQSDYWKIYNYLPKETRGYVPAFIAANYIMTYYCEHGICPMQTEWPAATDTVTVTRNLNLAQVAEVCGVELEQLRGLNPQYKRDIVPGQSQPSVLRLPQSAVNTFIDSGDSIYTYKADAYLTRRQLVDVDDDGRAAKPSGKATYHKVRKGDTLGSIGKKYGVSVAQLRRLNRIKGNNIPVGKSIRVK
jgi:membrane-bound lytic murein transglycosylase D